MTYRQTKSRIWCKHRCSLLWSLHSLRNCRDEQPSWVRTKLRKGLPLEWVRRWSGAISWEGKLEKLIAPAIVTGTSLTYLDGAAPQVEEAQSDDEDSVDDDLPPPPETETRLNKRSRPDPPADLPDMFAKRTSAPPKRVDQLKLRQKIDELQTAYKGLGRWDLKRCILRDYPEEYETIDKTTSAEVIAQLSEILLLK